MIKCPKETNITLELTLLFFILLRKLKEKYPQVYLEECKYKIKRTKMDKFINIELKSESESESDTELMAMLESNSDTE